MFFRKEKSIRMSLPAVKELYGVKIVKLPVARYIVALNTLENLPQILIDEIMPEVGSLHELVKKLSDSDAKVIKNIISVVLKKAPTEFCNAVSKLLDIPIERLTDINCKNALSLNELTEIIIAFWETNDMSDFFVNVRSLKLRLTARKTTANTGFRGGLR